MAEARVRRHVDQQFEEKDFYLEGLRGRSVLVAVSPQLAAGRPDLGPLAHAVADLVRNDARVVLWWPSVGTASPRRLLAALRQARLVVRRRGTRHVPASLVTIAGGGTVPNETLRAALWSALRRGRLCVLDVAGDAFPDAPVHVAIDLRVPKVVLLDQRGGLLSDMPGRLSFVDENLLETLLRQGEAEWSGLGERRQLLVAVRSALLGGVESVNLCTADDVAQELFTYEGAGTLFTPSDYCHIAPLGLDDLAQAGRLLERGQREGLLKRRGPEEIGRILSVGYGAVFYPHHLAGVAGLLTAPYTAERAGEIVGLYTITRFKGEGLGERLVARLLSEAERAGLDYVFACALHERAQDFFLRIGFERVGHDGVPAAKWVGYEARRRRRVGVFRRRIAAVSAAAHG
jgi:amino-acid N-acetyltransferase